MGRKASEPLSADPGERARVLAAPTDYRRPNGAACAASVRYPRFALLLGSKEPADGLCDRFGAIPAALHRKLVKLSDQRFRYSYGKRGSPAFRVDRLSAGARARAA